MGRKIGIKQVLFRYIGIAYFNIFGPSPALIIAVIINLLALAYIIYKLLVFYIFMKLLNRKLPKILKIYISCDIIVCVIFILLNLVLKSWAIYIPRYKILDLT